MATDLYQAWDHRWLGAATMTLTDVNGANVVSIATTSKHCHLSLAAVTPDARDATAKDLGFSAFAAALQTAINAACVLDYTVTFETATPYYSIESNLGGTFTLTFAGSAGATMRRILGLTASTGSNALHGSDMRPWYVMRAEIDGRQAYDLPLARPGQVRAAVGDDASIYTLAPTRLIKTSKWEHRFEQAKNVHRAKADADTLVAGASWTWEDYLDHAARYAVPCVIKDATESLVFRTRVPFESGAARRRKADVDPQQTVVINATSIVGRL